MKLIIALCTGLVFGLGLIISGMTNPAKVLGFLDLAGAWDPSLALVMGGAILVGLIPFRFASRLDKSLVLREPMRVPTTTRIDRRLVLGSLTFGVGWGLAGYCPGPAMASLAIGSAKPWIFIVAMLAGMAVFEIQDRLAHSSRRATA